MAEYTAFDHTQQDAYVNNRILLSEIWDLATVYPCVASKIEIRIRQADPESDYLYDDTMSDAAIVVVLRWLDTANACSFFACHGTYPLNGEGVNCRPVDEPRLIPTGDSSVVAACEPVSS